MAGRSIGESSKQATLKELADLKTATLHAIDTISSRKIPDEKFASLLEQFQSKLAAETFEKYQNHDINRAVEAVLEQVSKIPDMISRTFLNTEPGWPKLAKISEICTKIFDITQNPLANLLGGSKVRERDKIDVEFKKKGH